ncbi:MAG: caspase domain-containing protein [Hyalangium sp.]|uniref:caspase family protein n=1 Tax=Hyalangium sp. TaxID=2028555 RepID=UPI003899A94E
MVRLALLVGIDDYPLGSHLYGCVNDARAIAKLLSRNADGTPNFQCRMMLSSEQQITRASLRDLAEEVFNKANVDMAVFYFAGHGSLHKSFGGHLVTQDCKPSDEGLSMDKLIALANQSPARERLIILDCCHAGAIDDLVATQGPVPLQKGVAILAGCGPDEDSRECGERGLFTRHVCDALEGGAADVRGFVTTGGIYAYLNEVLTGWNQQPLLHANLTKLTPIRRADSAVSDEKLRMLTEYFPTPDYVHPLDPSYEPSAEPEHGDHEAIFSRLQQFRAARLLVPVGTDHMYYAAMEKRSCRLTPLGQFYWRAAKAGKI